MIPPRPRDGARVVVLSGGGLSAASEIPAHLDAAGLWEGRRVEDVATRAAWERDRENVMRFYDTRRLNCVHVYPNDAHEALMRLQHRWGARRVVLASQSIDGLLVKAGAADVIEINGSLWSIACDKDFEHPHLQVAGPQRRDRRCATCGAFLRPDVRWVGEPPRQLDRIREAVRAAETLLCVGTEVLELATDLLDVAHAAGVRCVEINTVSSGGPFDDVITEPAEQAVPRLIAEWLGE